MQAFEVAVPTGPLPRSRAPACSTTSHPDAWAGASHPSATPSRRTRRPGARWLSFVPMPSGRSPPARAAHRLRDARSARTGAPPVPARGDRWRARPAPRGREAPPPLLFRTGGLSPVRRARAAMDGRGCRPGPDPSAAKDHLIRHQAFHRLPPPRSARLGQERHRGEASWASTRRATSRPTSRSARPRSAWSGSTSRPRAASSCLLDFEPDEAIEIAEEIRAAAEAAREAGRGGKGGRTRALTCLHPASG